MGDAQLSIVDAFTQTPFPGNLAASVRVREIPVGGWMAAVARGLNLSDTAFASMFTAPAPVLFVALQRALINSIDSSGVKG